MYTHIKKYIFSLQSHSLENSHGWKCYRAFDSDFCRGGGGGRSESLPTQGLLHSSEDYVKARFSRSLKFNIVRLCLYVGRGGHNNLLCLPTCCLICHEKYYPSRDSNPGPLDQKSNALSTALLGLDRKLILELMNILKLSSKTVSTKSATFSYFKQYCI